jgi:hypothetical protein
MYPGDDIVEVRSDPDLVQMLQALGVPWAPGRPNNGRAGTILVRLDAETDGRLEAAIGSLADLRWRYEPGRRLQMALDFPAPEVRHGD